MKTDSEKSIWIYVINTYLLFWGMVLGIGGIASVVLHASASVMKWVTVLCSWAPTFMLWLMVKRLLHGISIKVFYQRAFREKISAKLVLLMAIIIGGIFLISAWLTALVEKVPLTQEIQFVPALLGGNILFTVLEGPSGEESGWRGYLRPKLEERYGLLPGNIVLGLIWAFWHMPLWFVGSEYSGQNLLVYITSVVIVLTALTVMMGVVMKNCNNLFMAFWMHFCFNFSLTFFKGNISFFVIFAILYVVVGIGFVLFYIHSEKIKS